MDFANRVKLAMKNIGFSDRDEAEDWVRLVMQQEKQAQEEEPERKAYWIKETARLRAREAEVMKRKAEGKPSEMYKSAPGTTMGEVNAAFNEAQKRAKEAREKARADAVKAKREADVLEDDSEDAKAINKTVKDAVATIREKFLGDNDSKFDLNEFLDFHESLKKGSVTRLVLDYAKERKMGLFEKKRLKDAVYAKLYGATED